MKLAREADHRRATTCKVFGIVLPRYADDRSPAAGYGSVTVRDSEPGDPHPALGTFPAEAKPELIDKAFAQAEEQVQRYRSDPHLVPLLTQGKGLKAGALVFMGAHGYQFREWPEVSAAGSAF